MSGPIECLRIACYDRRNGRECWMAEHPDGRFTYGYRSKEAAEEAAAKPYDEADPLNTMSTC